MTISNKKILDDFTDRHSDARSPVNKWIEIIENSNFKSHGDLKAVFRSADYVGNSRYVFNIKGNKYRFVVFVIFVGGLIDIRFCGTHAEYNTIKKIENI